MASAIRATSRLLFRSAQRSRPVMVGFNSAAPSRRVIPSFAAGAKAFSGTPIRNEIIKRYSEDHEWISLDTDSKIATIGISDYAQKALGDVVYVELPEADLDVTAGDTVGAVESVKSASDIMSPLSGTVTEANPAVSEKPANINAGAETDGWLFKIQVNDGYEDEVAAMMDTAAYEQYRTSEEK